MLLRGDITSKHFGKTKMLKHEDPKVETFAIVMEEENLQEKKR